ncbi:MAG TPA: DUF2520 domain-containing protein [Pyrinomonadaceae bacterium]|nr:DUF2520 domain-containing protein [Pyrinomonadaceae bacterium]
MPSVTIVGIGRLGGAIALALAHHGYNIVDLVHRRPESDRRVAELIPTARPSTISDKAPIDADIIILTTPDPEIVNAAETMASRVRTDAIVMHTSGSLSSEILANLENPTASLHPLVSISDPVLGSEKFADAFFCIEGEKTAVTEAQRIAAALGGRPFSIDTSLKPLYHASAVMASGHFTALEDMAIEMLAMCGLQKEEAKRVLLPLIRSSLENLAGQPTEKALTGTFARADIEAFERHLAAFEDRVPRNIRETYLLLAARSLDLAEKAGASDERIAELRERIYIAKGKSE